MILSYLLFIFLIFDFLIMLHVCCAKQHMFFQLVFFFFDALSYIDRIFLSQWVLHKYPFNFFSISYSLIYHQKVTFTFLHSKLYK